MPDRPSKEKQFYPERFGSNEQDHFNAAYRNRPLLNGLVTAFYLAVFLFAILGGIYVLSGRFLKGLGALFLSAVAFLLWAVLHNWALGHPKKVTRPTEGDGE